MTIKELPYFYIDSSYGGNQDWMRSWPMRYGGCAALTACDICIYLAKYWNMENLYPLDLSHLSRRDYKKFGSIMRPFLPPRARGVNTTHLFTDGFVPYLKSRRNSALSFVHLQASEPLKKAEEYIRRQIDGGLPVAFLMLKNNRPELKDYVWHWFIVNGYKIDDDLSMWVKTATYGECHWFLLQHLWCTDYPEKGGIVLPTIL